MHASIDGWVSDEWMDGRTDGWMEGWMVGWMDGCRDGSMNAWDGCIDVWMDD